MALSILNKFGRGLYLKKRVLSSQKILERNFKVNSKFSFVQVGANDGISFDFLYDFVIKRNSSGVVIEPVKEYFQELLLNYRDFPKIFKINKAMHPSLKEVLMYRISPNTVRTYPDWVKGIASFDPEHHLRLNISSLDIIEETVECANFMDTIIENTCNKTDYLQIDTEGFDYEILKMVDFSVFKPQLIKFESVNLDEESKKNARLILKKNGYYLFNEFGDTIGVNLFKIKLYL